MVKRNLCESIFFIMLLIYSCSLVRATTILSSGKIIINETFYIKNPENVLSLDIYIPLYNPFLKINIEKCDMECSYQNKYLTIKVPLSKIKKGKNVVSAILKYQQNITLPYQEQTRNISKYIIATQNIQANLKEIKKISSQINKTCNGDIKCIILRTTQWVNKNIKYDLKYSDKNYNTSWILKHKRGVCSEYNTLFISILRSLKIPSRYISSIVYDQETHQTTPHAYSEVYYNKKWHPVDVLWKEINYVDAMHIGRGYSKDNKIKSIINITFKRNTYFKWITEKFVIIPKKIENKNIFIIPNKTLNIPPNKSVKITLNKTELIKKDLCTSYIIFPCEGANISIDKKEGIICTKAPITIKIEESNIVCPLLIRYDNSISLLKISTIEKSKLLTNNKISHSFIEDLKKLFIFIISFIKSL